jgi:hypothetical protein
VPEPRLATVVVAVSLLALVHRLVVAAPEAPDRAAEALAGYEAVAPRLASADRIGFAPFHANAAAAGAAQLLAQNAVAPRLIDTDLGAVAVVISMPAASAALDADPRLAAFDLVGVSEAGIRIYRRRSP